MAKSKVKKGVTTNKKTYQGCGKWTKYPHNKRSRLYKKKYRGQGK